MIVKKKVSVKASDSKLKIRHRYIKAAEDDEMDDFEYDESGENSDSLMDAIDDVADNVEDIQDSFDDMKEDEAEIAINNNIADHYIAECSRCNQVFISAVVDSDQQIDHVTGICPLCRRETEQRLKWVIKPVE